MQMQKRVTIKEVAAAAGVNAATASRALAGQAYVAAETRARVLAVAEQLGYRPDPALSALAMARWRRREERTGNCLGLIYWEDGRVRWDPQLKGFVAEAERLGYAVEIFRKADYANEAMLERVLRTRGIRGVALSLRQPKVVAPRIDWSPLAVVQIGVSPGGQAIADTCGTDTFGNHVELMREALAAGARRPGVVLLEPRFMFEELRRIGGLEAAWAEHGGRGRVPRLWLRTSDAEASAKFAAWVTRNRLDAVLGQSPWVESLVEALGGGCGVRFVDLSILRHADRIGQAAARLLAGKVQQAMLGLPEVPLFGLIGNGGMPGAQ